MNDERNALPSASGLARISLCPGSWLMERGLPDESTPDAETGNKVHYVLSLETRGASIQEELKKLTTDELNVFDACVAYENLAFDQFKVFNGIKLHPVETLREERLWMRDSSFSRLWSGKPDVVYLWERHALVIDYKTGRDPVSAKDNLQLQALAVLVFCEYGCDIVGVKIVQPHASADEMVIYVRSDLERMAGEIDDLVERAQRPGQAMIPSEDACRYCKARSTCPAALKVVETLPAEVPRQSGEIMLTPERMAQVLDAARVAEDVIESVRNKAKRMLEAGIAIPGWKLKPGVVKESIVDVPTLFNRFSAAGGTQEQFIATVTVAKTRLKDAVRDATGAKGKALDAQLDAMLDGITESKQNSPSLVK